MADEKDSSTAAIAASADRLRERAASLRWAADTMTDKQRGRRLWRLADRLESEAIEMESRVMNC